MRIPKLNTKKAGLSVAALAVFVGGLLALRKTTSFEVDGTAQIAKNTNSVSSITGEPCTHADQRPMAVMFASDPVARPLSGISQTDITFEMPVTPGGVTRMMGVFQCNQPELIGSIRSARQDFIPLVSGLGAIYAHWGGEHDALAELNSGIIDNVDALKYEGSTFYRYGKLKPPHNGFSDMSKLLERAKNLGYSLKGTFGGYLHGDIPEMRSMSNISTAVNVPYVAPYDVAWQYDAQSGRYLRSRNGQVEIDAAPDAGNKQVSAAVIITMETAASPINEFYNRVTVTGQGRATIYQKGIEVSAIWKKDQSLDSKLLFLDDNGKEIVFTPGNIWVEIITN